MVYNESPLTVVAKGAVSGLIGTAVLSGVMRGLPVALRAIGIEPPPTPSPEKPPQRLAKKIAGGIFGKRLGREEQQTTGQAIHWAYGAGWGALYGITQSSLRPPHFLHGTMLGIMVTVVASTLVPAMRLTPPPTKVAPAAGALQFAEMLTYGWVTAFAYRWLARDQ